MTEASSNSNKINEMYLNFTNKEKEIDDLTAKLHLEEINKRKLEEQTNDLFNRVQQKENIVISLKGTLNNLSEQKKALEAQINSENDEQHLKYTELVKAEENASQLEQEIMNLKMKHNQDMKAISCEQYNKHEILSIKLLKALGKH